MIRFLALVRKEFQVLARDWQGLLVLFVMPALFILIMSLALRDAFDGLAGVDIEYLFVDRDRQPQSVQLRERLADNEGFRALDPPAGGATNNAIRSAVARGSYPLALVVPEGFSVRMRAGDTSSSEKTPLLRLYVAPSTLPQLKALFAMTLRRELQRLRAQGLISEAHLPEAVATRLMALDATAVAVEYPSGERGDSRVPNAVQQNVPAWLVFAMFFAVIPISTVFIVERQQGTLSRLKAMGLSSYAMLGGKLVPYYLVNLVQMGVMLAVGVWLVPHLGGDALTLGHSPGGLLIIGSAVSIAAIGFSLLISTLARTSVQAATFGGIANLVFGAVGGIMVPKAVMSPAMQRFTNVSPMSWGLEGFWDVLLYNGGWQDVLPEALALAGFGALCLAGAAVVFNRI